MGSAWNQIYIICRDLSGRESCNFLATQDQSPWSSTPVDDLVAAYQDISDAGVYAVQVLTTKIINNAPSSGPYNTTFDRATLLTKYVDGVTGHIDVVAPKSDIFDAAHQRVLMSDSRVVTLVTKLEAIIGDNTGSPIRDVPYGNRTKVTPVTG